MSLQCTHIEPSQLHLNLSWASNKYNFKCISLS